MVIMRLGLLRTGMYECALGAVAIQCSLRGGAKGTGVRGGGGRGGREFHRVL